MTPVRQTTRGSLVLRSLCIALAAGTMFGADADDVLQCRNGKLVRVGMVAAEVVARCGEPSTRSTEDVPVRARTPNGNVIVTGTARLERWTYKRGQGQFDALLSFDSDKLTSIELLTNP